jgi:hypothetical protein
MFAGTCTNAITAPVCERPLILKCGRISSGTRIMSPPFFIGMRLSGILSRNTITSSRRLLIGRDFDLFVRS